MPEQHCALHCISVESRRPLPPGWSTGHSFALVRRGIIVRQRLDGMGCTTAVDAVGPGGATPLPDGSDGTHAGYATDDAMICMCPTQALSSAIDAGAPTSGEIVGLHRAALDRVERLADARGRRTALARVAAALCVLADTLSPPEKLEVIPSSFQQRDLAQLTGLRHESVCRVYRVLERRGAIRWSSDGTRIVDRRILEAVE